MAGINIVLSCIYYAIIIKPFDIEGAYKEVILNEANKSLTFIYFDERIEIVELKNFKYGVYNRNVYSGITSTLKGGKSYYFEYYLIDHERLNRKVLNLLKN